MRKAKFILLSLVLVFTFFFTNDFGLIDVEKTSIITAIAVDKEDDGYLITAQIAVPEATDANTENRKAEISGKGKTVGEALKNTGDVSGWFPKLAFCNLILLGSDLSQTNVIRVLDYFAKTLRVQDSALVALAENKASELLKLATPLDNISSFALQKIMLKNPGFDRDVTSSDVKSFCSGHYSDSSSAFMPLIKVIKSDSGNSSQGSQSSGNSGSGSSSISGSNSSSSSASSGGNADQKKMDNLFDARTTALFKDGVKVGELTPELTFMFNAYFLPLDGTTLPVDDVEINGKKCNALLTILTGKPSVKVKADEQNLTVELSLTLYCKITDVDSDYTEEALSQNLPLPQAVKDKTEQMLTERTNELVEIIKNTGCDFLKIKEKLYRHNYGQYSRYKDNYLSVMNADVKIDVQGQK